MQIDDGAAAVDQKTTKERTTTMKLKKLLCSALILGISTCFALAADFGDHSSSTLTGKAWDAMGKGQYDEALIYINKCKELYEGEALKQQASLGDNFAPKGKEFDYWALNDVGTCYFIQGEILEKQGKKEEQLAVLRTLSTKLKSAQCWDANGWFWKPAEAAATKLKQLEFDASM
jgi:tetratricopeptide (TPR) repeat protein